MKYLRFSQTSSLLSNIFRHIYRLHACELTDVIHLQHCSHFHAVSFFFFCIVSDPYSYIYLINIKVATDACSALYRGSCCALTITNTNFSSMQMEAILVLPYMHVELCVSAQAKYKITEDGNDSLLLTAVQWSSLKKNI